jgi:hypothetical protein
MEPTIADLRELLKTPDPVGFDLALRGVVVPLTRAVYEQTVCACGATFSRELEPDLEPDRCPACREADA